jgi:galactose mutarotase-like enzyme
VSADRPPAGFPTAGSSGPSPRISTEWSLAGQPAVVLENRRLRAVVLPGLGGKIISLVDKVADAELLWRSDRVPVRPVPFGSGYDDAFLGGWDELFPNDEPEVLAGEAMPDHGELWSLPWLITDLTAGDDQVTLELAVRPPISATCVTKRLVLGDGPELRTDYRLTNEGRRELPFLWKSHVAVRLHPDTVIGVAAGDVLVHEFGDPRVRPEGGRFDWPSASVAGTEHDFRRPPDTTARGVTEFLIATTLDDGRCGVEHPVVGTGLTLTWDPADLPSCWTFASYGGGWRGLDVLVLEPCTGHPLSVLDGVAAGTHQVLAAGATREWSLTARVGPPVRA